MDSQRFRTTAGQWITGFDLGAHRAIDGWRSGGERLGQAARARWDRAYAESKPQLSAETRRNATHFRDVVSRYYGQGLEGSAQAAERAVASVVQAVQSALAGRMAR